MIERHGVMNNTKWEELRLAMYGIEPAPRCRCMTTSGYCSDADAEWFYHFRAGGYDDIRYVDIFVERLLRNIAHSVTANHPECQGYLVVLLIVERLFALTPAVGAVWRSSISGTRI